MSVMQILVGVLLGLVVGFLAFLLAGLFPFTAGYTHAIALVVGILTFVAHLYGDGRWFNRRPL